MVIVSEITSIIDSVTENIYDIVWSIQINTIGENANKSLE